MPNSSVDHRKKPADPVRPVSALQCWLAYAAALTAGALAWRLLRGMQLFASPLWLGFAVTCLCTVVIWIFSIANGNSSIYDPYWVIAPPFLALALKASTDGGLQGPWTARQLSIAACLMFWAADDHAICILARAVA